MNDLHNTWPHRWVNPKARQQPSPINGVGLFATGDISKGEIIVVYGGVIIPNKDLPTYRQMVGNYDYPISEEFSIAPTSKEEIYDTGSVNHSCEPNAGWNDVLTFSALKDIKKGEEITPDYAFMGDYAEPISCNCGSPICRGVITQDDWKIKSIQDKYRDWFIPVLRAKF